MSVMQRNKGANYEREVANILADYLGIVVNRQLGQSRDGGYDLTQIGKFKIECKRRASIAVYEWLDQCDKCCTGHDVPIVIARADAKESIVILRLTDFLPLLSGELGTDPCSK